MILLNKLITTGLIIGTLLCDDIFTQAAEQECSYDWIFVIEDTSNTSLSDFQQIQEFMIDIASSISIGENQSLFSVLTYARNLAFHFDLHDNTDQSSLIQDLRNGIGFSGTTNVSNTAGALQFIQSHPWLNLRPGYPHVAIIFTEGYSIDPAKTLLVASELHSTHVYEIFAIGINSPNIQELQGIASQDHYVFASSPFTVVSSQRIKKDILSILCSIAPYNVTIMGDNIYDSGDQLELNCSSEGGPDLVYSWSRVNDFSSDTVTNTSTLNVSDLVTVDGGDYTCTVTNDAGTSSTTVTVYVAPYNVVIMGDNTYDNGDQLELNCLSEGGPDLLYSWSRTNTFSNDTVTNLNTLTISDLATVDGGEYTCSVTNDAGTSMNTITVNVWQGLQNGSIKTYNCPFDCLSAYQ